MKSQLLSLTAIALTVGSASARGLRALEDAGHTDDWAAPAVSVDPPAMVAMSVSAKSEKMSVAYVAAAKAVKPEPAADSKAHKVSSSE